jgi:hypothetical protein
VSEPVKRLPLKQLEEWKAKAKALDAAVEWLKGRIGCERCMKVYDILTRRDDRVA